MSFDKWLLAVCGATLAIVASSPAGKAVPPMRDTSISALPRSLNNAAVCANSRLMELVYLYYSHNASMRIETLCGNGS